MKPSKGIKFVFEGVGTRGDVVPLLAIAAELVQRGHTCHLLANAMFRREATARGVGFSPICEHTAVFSGPDRYRWENYLFVGLERVVDHLTLHGHEQTLIVNLDRLSASSLASERYDIPLLRLHLSPFKLRSLSRPPWPWGAKTRGALGRAYLRSVFPRVLEACETDPRILTRINDCRRSLGLAATGSSFYDEPHLVGQVALFANWFAVPAPDWPKDLTFAGFPRPAGEHQLPDWLQRFLDGEKAPMVFTPGTGVRDASQFFADALQCCQKLAMPGVFLSPCQRAVGVNLAARIAYVDFVELAPLVRQSALLVHHGGIGTLACALEAGIPQIIRPRGFDQPDNGSRVEELKVGRVVVRSEDAGSELARAAAELLNSEAVSARLRSLAALVGNADGTEACTNILERLSLEHVRSNGSSRVPSAATGCGTAPRVITGGNVASSGHVHSKGGRPPRPRVALVVGWPEPGHVASPLALAQQLRARGDKVVFAGARQLRMLVTPKGFEFCDLSTGRNESRSNSPSVFSWMPGSWALVDAVDHLQEAFAAAVARYRPAVVLIDSLYSPLCILAANHRIPSALYETDLPRGFDPGAPPPSEMIVPDADGASRHALRVAWARQLWRAFRDRRASLRHPVGYAWSMNSYFPDALIAELGRRTSTQLRFDRRTLFAPAAQVPTMVFCPREFDFDRRNSEHLTWVGPYVDQDRAEPELEWAGLRVDRPVAYAAFGTQTHRERGLLRLLQTVAAAFATQDRILLVLSCPASYHAVLQPFSERVHLVSWAPQLALLKRACVALTHGGFNSIKECALSGVPMVVLPLSHDQPRNAALIAWHRLGIALNTERLGVLELQAAVAAAWTSAEFRRNCERMRRIFEASSAERLALAELDRLLDESGPRPFQGQDLTPAVARRPAAPHSQEARVDRLGSDQNARFRFNHSQSDT